MSSGANTLAAMTGVTGGVDLGGTKIQTVAVREGQVVGESRRPTPRTGAADVLTAMAEALNDALAGAQAKPQDLRAVGVGTPGQVDVQAGTVRGASNVPGFIDVVALLDAPTVKGGTYPVVLDNDVRMATLGEHKRGAGRPYSDLLCVFVGTGVGGGIVLGGELRRGRGTAGEIGHTVVRLGGRRCPCGRRGCLEAYAGRVGIEARARKRHEKGEPTVLFHIMEREGAERATSGIIGQALKKGDPLTTRLIEQAVQALGAGIGSAQNLLDVEAVILGGGLSDKLGPPFVERVESAMLPHVFAAGRSPKVLPSELGDLSGAVGAAVAAGG